MPRLAGRDFVMRIDGEEVPITDLQMDVDYGYGDMPRARWSAGGIIHPIFKNTIEYEEGEQDMSTVKKLAELQLDDDTKLLRKHKIIDAEGFVTAEGAKVLVQLALDEHKDALVAQLKKLDEEDQPKKIAA